MKRKFFSIFLALVLLLTLGLVTAVPAAVAADEGTNYSPFGTVLYIWGADGGGLANAMKWWYIGGDGSAWDGHQITIVNSQWPEFNGQWYLKNTGAAERFTLWRDAAFTDQVTTANTGSIGSWENLAAYAIDGWVVFNPAVDTVGDPRETFGNYSGMWYDRADAGSTGGNLEVKFGQAGEYPPNDKHGFYHGWYLELVDCGWTDLNGGWYLKYVADAGGGGKFGYMDWYELYADPEFTVLGIPQEPDKFEAVGGEYGYLFGPRGRFVFPYEAWVDDEGDDSNPGTEGLPFVTIQKGIDMVPEGGTINVAAGTYYEHIKIDEALTVKSTDGAEVTIIDGIAFRYMVDICSSDVTFDGFTVTNPTYAGGSDATGILIQSAEAMSNVHILDNIITQVRSETGSSSMYGATGINIGKGPLSDILISGNTITDIKNPDGASVDHTCGINIWDGAENVVISNNTISDIKYNGIMLQYASGVQIEGNSITQCEAGIRVEPFPGVTVSGLVAEFNNITGNTHGVQNMSFDTLDAQHNWWGAANGPGQDGANDVFGNVDYSPWLPGTWQTYYDPVTEAQIDSDGDGFSDLQEYWLGTEPEDDTDFPGAAVEEVVTGYAPAGGDGTAEITDVASVTATAGATGAAVSLTEYSDTPAPGDESVFGAVGSYVDVHCDTPENLEEVEIRVSYDDAGMSEAQELALRMYYWDIGVGDWCKCSDQGVNTTDDYIWAKIRDDTTPDLSYLAGGPFGGGPGSVELDSEWYKTGATVEVTIEDATESGIIAAFAWSDTVHEAGKITCALFETGAGTGIFEGDFDLVDTPPGAGELLVNNGDLITVEYIGAGYTATVDDIAPLISVVGPLGPINLNTPVIAASYSDDASLIDTATAVMTVDGVPAVAVVTVTELGISYHPIEPLGDGEHTVTVDVSDIAGNAATQASWSFTVNTIKPKLDIGLAPDPPYTDEGTVTFTLTFNEDMDIAFPPVVTFGLADPYDQHPVSGVWTAESLTEWVGTFDIDVTWVLGDDGGQTLSVSAARDLAGNEMGTDTSTTFVIDPNAPDAPTLVLPGDGVTIQTTAKPTFQWDAVIVDVSGVTYQLQVDDAADFLSPELNVALISETTYIPPEALANAEYSWRVRAIDGVDNEGDWSAVRTFTLNADTIDPEVTLISPNGGEVWQGGSEETISWTALDNITPDNDLRFTLHLSRGGDWDVDICFEKTAADPEITLEEGVFSYTWTVGDYNNDHCRIKVDVIDLQSNTAFDVSDDYFTIGTPVIFVFELGAGWNLISLPMIPDDAAIATILAPIADGVDIVWGYNPVNSPDDPWAVYVPGVIEDELTLMVDGMGYWVYMSEPVALTVSGVAMLLPPDPPSSYDVASGWNLIGFKSTETTPNVEYLISLEEAYSVLWGYDAIEGYFNVYPLDEHNGDMESGYGYWLWATQDGILVPPQ